jgi:hypothetical protein
MLSEKAANTNAIVFGLTGPGLDPTIYRTLGEHANQENKIYSFLEQGIYIYIGQTLC